MLLYLVRHGETESNRAGLALGRADVPLNERGLWQAGRLAEALASERFAAIYTSPLMRARQTADAIAERHGLSPVIEPGLIEMDIGEVEQLPFAEVRSRYPGLLEAWAGAAGPNQAMPGGERLIDVQERAWRTVRSLSTRHAEETVCAVTHNFVILTVLATALGTDLAHFRRIRHGLAAVSVIEMTGDRVRVRRMNDSCHLDGADNH